MTTLLRALTLSIGSLVAARALSQNLSPEAWVAQHYERKTEAMTVLTGWGTANVLTGGISAAVSENEQLRQFYLMNAGWGAINATLGYFGRRSALRDASASKTAREAYADLRSTEKILLFNAGLDIGYVAAGAYLLERSRRPGSGTSERNKGWGQAIILQGAALCLFDLLTYRHLHRGEGALRLGGQNGLDIHIGSR